ncbi:MAG: cytochrome c [Mediterranea sp.]|jgi:hypothetical protein|nr:cytochrome c [Mediterranea sp.]
MKKTVSLLSVALSLLSGCDDGKIYPKENEDAAGKKITLTARFKGLEAWPEAYRLVLAGFGDENGIPLISKMIPQPLSETQEISVTLNGVSNAVEVVSVSVLTKGNAPICHLYRMELKDTGDEFTLPVNEINVASYDRIQRQVFNLYCAGCHGAGNQAAAELYLTEGKSYDALINRSAATSTDGKLRVKPGSTAESYLNDILTSDIVNYNHTDVLPENELITLIETWIKEGAAR